jgi:hypothetical protein
VSRNEVDGITHTGEPFANLDKTAWKVFAGFRPLRVFALEADYMDLGNRTYSIIGGTDTHADAKAWAGYAVRPVRQGGGRPLDGQCQPEQRRSAPAQ